MNLLRQSAGNLVVSQEQFSIPLKQRAPAQGPEVLQFRCHRVPPRQSRGSPGPAETAVTAPAAGQSEGDGASEDTRVNLVLGQSYEPTAVMATGRGNGVLNGPVLLKLVIYFLVSIPKLFF